ncbi:MAG: hypothetical protein R3E01_36370 [Pirellulaceae bacterium]|nr:hypothetical protein [Planctomycetales bacterium]
MNATKSQQYQQTYNEAVKSAVEKTEPTRWQNFKSLGFAELSAYGREGMDTLAQALKAFPDSLDFAPPEPGTFAEPPMQEIYADRKGLDPMQAFQRDLHAPEPQQQREASR